MRWLRLQAWSACALSPLQANPPTFRLFSIMQAYRGKNSVKLSK